MRHDEAMMMVKPLNDDEMRSNKITDLESKMVLNYFDKLLFLIYLIQAI